MKRAWKYLVAAAMVATLVVRWWPEAPTPPAKVSPPPAESIHRTIELTADAPPPVGLPRWAPLAATMPEAPPLPDDGTPPPVPPEALVP